jgi:hypothetical protein
MYMDYSEMKNPPGTLTLNTHLQNNSNCFSYILN